MTSSGESSEGSFLGIALDVDMVPFLHHIPATPELHPQDRGKHAFKIISNIHGQAQPPWTVLRIVPGPEAMLAVARIPFRAGRNDHLATAALFQGLQPAGFDDGQGILEDGVEFVEIDAVLGLHGMPLPWHGPRHVLVYPLADI